nr:MAG TPA: hypothetical protein [Caudoviricetes sp.]
MTASTISPFLWVLLPPLLRSTTSRDGLNCPERGDNYGFSLLG